MNSNNELITIEAILLVELDKAWQLDCEGDIEWFPKSLCSFNKNKEELTAPLWLLKQKFPDTKF